MTERERISRIVREFAIAELSPGMDYNWVDVFHLFETLARRIEGTEVPVPVQPTRRLELVRG